MEARTVLRDLRHRPEELQGDAAVCVAVLDGPVDLTHPCFEGADLTRVDTLVGGPVGRGPMALHGTHVASLLFGRLGSSVAGIVPRCRGLVLPVFQDAGGGTLSQLDLARAIERAVEEGAHVINISGGERSADGQAEGMLQRALRLCEDRGVLVVAAVGNDGCDCLQVPSAVPSVLAVGAADATGAPLAVNNWGSVYRTNGVLAPGALIEGAAPGGGRQALTGSSFATPLVAGVAALLVTAQLRQGAPADPLAAGRAILETASSIPCTPDDSARCRRHLAGAMRAGRAYERITGRGSTPGSGSGAFPSTPVVASDSSERDSAMDNEHLHAATGDGAEAAPPGALPPDPGGFPQEPAEPVTQQTEPAQAPYGTGFVPDPPPAVPPPPSAPPPSVPPPAPAPATAQNSGGVALAAAPSAPAPVAHPPADPGIRPSCGCGGSSASGCRCAGDSTTSTSRRPPIYAIGSIGFDFRTEANRDAFTQLMPAHVVSHPDGDHEYPAMPYDPLQMYDYLVREPWQSSNLTWTLVLDSTPVYALEAEPTIAVDWGTPLPDGSKSRASHAGAAQTGQTEYEHLGQQLHQLQEALSNPPVSVVHKTFREAIKGQVTQIEDPPDPSVDIEGIPRGYSYLISRVSIPGILTDRTVRLYSGQVVPVVEVQSRGLYTWNERALVDTVVAAVKKEADLLSLTVSEGEVRKNVRALLDKIYYQFRNLGQSSADRALNAAGTNAFLFAKVFAEGLMSTKYVPGANDRMYSLDTVTVTKSPFCRPGADCQEVRITFFDPEDDRRARVTYQFTIDVSEPFGVSIVPVHHFLET
ncbi:S8 family serine peptidase [Streptomyces klenkii]|uniref:cyanobactin maturation protease PatG family protein n=1 Tax=Streptomyces klenkii TaxID=1420899 RepID=UPI003449869A